MRRTTTRLTLLYQLLVLDASGVMGDESKLQIPVKEYGSTNSDRMMWRGVFRSSGAVQYHVEHLLEH
jgi:hypothetical protein